MTTETLTPYEVACDFLRIIRAGDYDPGSPSKSAGWAVNGQPVAWHEGRHAVADFGLDPEENEVVWLESDWLELSRVTGAELAEACPIFALDRFTPGLYLSMPRTRLLDALGSTETNDAHEFCRVVGIDRRDPEILHALSRVGLDIAANEYEPLRKAVRSKELEYAIALLQSDLPLEAIMQLCVLPPMPVEYAVATAGGAA